MHQPYACCCASTATRQMRVSWVVERVLVLVKQQTPETDMDESLHRLTVWHASRAETANLEFRGS